MQPRDKARGTVTELELCHGRGVFADIVIDTLRLAFEFEADYRVSLRQEQKPQIPVGDVRLLQTYPVQPARPIQSLRSDRAGVDGPKFYSR